MFYKVVTALQRQLYAYRQLVEYRSSPVRPGSRSLAEWQDRLFIQFLVYCFPISLIAVVPCVIISFQSGYFLLGSVDLISFLLIAYTTISKKLSLKARKIIIITIFYVLSIFLIANLGYIGPGVFYLLAITVLIALFFPVRFAYFSVISNGATLVAFSFIIHFKLFNSILNSQYTATEWLAFSSNLLFLSILLVVLINIIFKGLQSIIIKNEQAKANYKNIFEMSPTPMWLFNIDTLRFLDVNEAAIAHYGYEKDEFLDMTIKDIRPEIDRQSVKDIVERNRHTPKYTDRQIVHFKKNGEAINVKIESSIVDFNGTSAKLVLATDITETIRHEREIAETNNKIKQSELHLRAIFDSSIQGFVLLDIDAQIVTFNSSASDFIKLNDHNNIAFQRGESIYRFVEGARKMIFRSMLMRVFEGETIEYDRRHDLPEGQQWIHYTLTPVYEKDEVVGYCITGYDITAVKQHIQTIETQNKKFLEISWLQSHMVRAPLARLMGLTTLILAEDDKTQLNEMLSYFKISADELDGIIKDITYKINENKLSS